MLNSSVDHVVWSYVQPNLHYHHHELHVIMPLCMVLCFVKNTMMSFSFFSIILVSETSVCVTDFIFIIQLLVNATPRIMTYCSELVEPINSAAFRITPDVLGEWVGWFTWLNIPKQPRL